MSLTPQQRKALHKYCEQLADALNDAGFSQNDRVVIKLDIPYSKLAVKEAIWKPIQEAITGKTSTEELDPKEVGEIYKIMDNAVAERTNGVRVEFPSEESLSEGQR